MTGALAVASFKLQLAEGRARLVPARDASGCAFVGPGVDLVGGEALEAFALAEPLLAWLRAREPVQVRSLSVDVGRRRVLVTVETGSRPRVVRVDAENDPAGSEELVRLAAPVMAFLGRAAADKLARRAD